MSKIKSLDYAAIFINIIIIGFFSFIVYSGDNKETVVRIESEGKVWLYPIEENRIVSIPGPIGNTVIEIKDNIVKVIDSPCPDKLCIQAGELKTGGDWAACLPNRIFITIEGPENEEIDILNY